MPKFFKDLERANAQIDIWIDEEDYRQIYKTIKIVDSETADLIEKIFPDSTDTNRNRDSEESDIDKFPNLFSDKLRISIKISDAQSEGKSVSDGKLPWRPLFFAKYLRAKIMEDGTDDYTKHLDKLVTYLQRKLPYQSTKNDQDLILQHLYYQELSACGKPGLESLGFAVQAHDLIAKKEGTENAFHFSFELYKLWAKLNQGIGYWHSNQKREAADAFNEIIREFDDKAKCLQADEKGLWRSLLYDQAILFRAELQEALQFSYHTVRTLEKLDGRKKEHRLVKEALAYRDMGRLNDSREKIEDLLEKKPLDSIKKAFKQFDRWKIGKKKKGIWSKTLGLLFDYYLQEFENKDNEPTKSKVDFLVKKFKAYKKELLGSKPERVSYYQQVARYLEWLSDRYKKNSNKKSFFKAQIEQLYKEVEEELPGVESDQQKQGKDQGIDLDEFGKYEYDRFTNSMEKFFKQINKEEVENNNDRKDYRKYEIKFLSALNDFEENKFWLYEFKKLERKQRIDRLNNKSADYTEKSLKCFNGEDSIAFDGILECAKKVKNRNYDEVLEFFNIGLRPIGSTDYETIMERENDRFLDRLQCRSRHPIYSDSKTSYHFVGLQRWNSQTPTLTLSLGGGYLLYGQDEKGCVTLGIAIDPGFDFVKNLFHMGFTLNDIDFILISHAHSDHIRDFEPIVSSLLDLKKRRKDLKKKIHVIMSQGVYHKLKHIITNTTLRELLADTYIVDIDKETHPPDNENKLAEFVFKRSENGSNHEFVSVIPQNREDKIKGDIKIKPTLAYHDDYSDRSDSFGYIIEFFDSENGKEEKDPVFSFGYTGDTKWKDSIPGHYSTCDSLCIHLGALIESEKEKKNVFSYYNGQHCEELIEEKGHLYLFGLLRFLKSIKENSNNKKNKLILISEFGEELKGGIRIDFVRRLNRLLKNDSIKRVCIPVDIGLNVVLARQSNKENNSWEKEPYKAWCYGCEKFIDVNKLQYRHFGYGNDEALFYFCDVCLKTKPENTLQEKMRLMCETGLPLQKVHE